MRDDEPEESLLLSAKSQDDIEETNSGIQTQTDSPEIRTLDQKLHYKMDDRNRVDNFPLPKNSFEWQYKQL